MLGRYVQFLMRELYIMEVFVALFNIWPPTITIKDGPVKKEKKGGVGKSRVRDKDIILQS